MLRKIMGFMMVFVLVFTMLTGNALGQNYGRKVAVDQYGNICVMGYSQGSETLDDYATVKYDPAGNELWVARYNGPANWIDSAIALAVDQFGNVYVTGWSFGIGTWIDYATVKYDPAGNELWVARYNGPGYASDDYVRALAVDQFGNVYVTGYSFNWGSGAWNSDYVTVKYDPAGNELWVARYNGPADSVDEASAIAVDSSGNVYVTGDSWGDETYTDYATVKYDPAGNELWVARYNGPGNGYDAALAIAVDSSGNVYVTGDSSGSGTSWDYVTVKYDSAGNELWVARYNGPADSRDLSNALVVDSSGNAYVTGSSMGSGTALDYATVKYDSAGDELWVARYSGPENDTDIALDLAVDDFGNVYVTGHSVGSETGSDYTTVKYGSAGNEFWVAKYNGLENGKDIAYDLVMDALGNVYVTGTSGEYIPGESIAVYATVKYDPFGVELWVALYENLEFAIELLIKEVQKIGLKDGAGFTAKLEAASKSFQKGTSHDYVAAFNELEAFKNKCENDPQLTEPNRTRLINNANDIIAYIQSLLQENPS